jgi:MFS family permease
MNLGSAITSAVVVVFLVRTLHQSASAVGLLMSAGAVGGVLGAATAGRFARRVGQVRAIWLGPLATSPFLLLLPLAQEGPLLALVVLAELVGVVGLVYFNVAQVSLRQAVTPPQLLGRMNATMRFLVWGPLPLGGVVGGALGDAIGVRPTLWVGVLVTQVGLLPLLTPALRRGEAPAFDPDEELLGLAERVQQQ